MLIISLIFLGFTEPVHSEMDTNLGPYGSFDDDLGLYDPFYDNNNPNNPTCEAPIPPYVLPVYKIDIILLQFAQNLEHLECDFFLWSALGYGLDEVAPQLTLGGPPPIGVQKANLDNLTRNIITEFGLEEIGHLRLSMFSLYYIDLFIYNCSLFVYISITYGLEIFIHFRIICIFRNILSTFSS